ncbi:MAG: WYL domain-containing protein [Phycisphaerales bacterium]|nr:WYL domain-containing protein [Phycisphaerales bacterium]
MNTDVVRALVELAELRRMVRLTYRRSLSALRPDRRIVEPYSFAHHFNDIVLRCYQHEPEAGWRFLRLARIDAVEDGGQAFQPRRRIHLPTEEFLPEAPATSSPWTPELRAYRDLIYDALADGKLTEEERLSAQQFALERGILLSQLRFVHAAVFHECLGLILEDGEVEDDERAQLRFLHRVLTALGWSVSEG